MIMIETFVSGANPCAVDTVGNVLEPIIPKVSLEWRRLIEGSSLTLLINNYDSREGQFSRA